MTAAEQLAVAVLRGDRSAIRPLLDAIREDLDVPDVPDRPVRTGDLLLRLVGEDPRFVSTFTIRSSDPISGVLNVECERIFREQVRSPRPPESSADAQG